MEPPLSELLADFAGALTSATYAPDDYPMPEYVNYGTNMADLRELWAKIGPRLQATPEKVAFIDRKLAEAFNAFEEGEKSRGRTAVLAIYNLDVEGLW